MKFEEYHQRLMAERAADGRRDPPISPDPNRCNQAVYRKDLDSLERLLFLAEVAFYRQHWWQIWRPRKPDI